MLCPMLAQVRFGQKVDGSAVSQCLSDTCDRHDRQVVAGMAVMARIVWRAQLNVPTRAGRLECLLWLGQVRRMDVHQRGKVQRTTHSQSNQESGVVGLEPRTDRQTSTRTVLHCPLCLQEELQHPPDHRPVIPTPRHPGILASYVGLLCGTRHLEHSMLAALLRCATEFLSWALFRLSFICSHSLACDCRITRRVRTPGGLRNKSPKLVV